MNHHGLSHDKNRLRELEGMRLPHREAYFRVMQVLRPKIAWFLDHLRHSEEKVYLSTPHARGGNWLYLWACADADRRAGAGDLSYVLKPAGCEPWLEEFSALEELTLDPKDFKFLHRRTVGLKTDVEGSYAPGALEHFIRERLLSSANFQRRMGYLSDLVTDQTVVLSIRRGDYYSYPAIRRRYGIDTVAYVRAALEKVLERMNPSNFVITSDDPAWCRENLTFLEDYAPVRYDKVAAGMFADLAVLAKARWLILTNTTFGYWGAYMAQADHPAQVYVPNVHEYDPQTGHPVGIDENGRAYPHDARWHAVEPSQTHTWLLPEELDDAATTADSQIKDSHEA